MRRLVAWVAVLAAAAGACGGGTSRLADDLLAVTRVAEVDVAEVRFVGKDIAGTVAEVGNTGEPRVLVYEFAVADARIFDTYPEVAPPPETIRFGRDAISFRAVEQVAEEAEKLVVLLRPFVVPTRGGVLFEGLVVAVAADGSIVGSDWVGEDAARLEAVAGDDPAVSLAELVGALSRQVRGATLSPRDRELLDAVGAA